MKQMECLPSLEQVEAVTGFVEETLGDFDVPMKISMQFCIAVDEIFSNIVYYSHASTAWISCGVEDNTAILRFEDDGIPYDPTTIPEPDVSLSAEERGVGGLGMFMVKKSMDTVQYASENNHNILTLFKKLP